MSVSLFYGEETYLIDMKLKRIKKEFGEMIQGINYIQIDETNVEQMISDIDTPAFGYPKKLIIAKNTNLFKKERKSTSKNNATKETKTKTKSKINKEESTQEKIANYLLDNEKMVNEATEIVFIEEIAEKNKLYETISKIGQVKEFEQLRLPDLVLNLRKIANAYKVNIDDNTTRYLIESCGTSMQDLINEIRKLIEYRGEDGTIIKEDIDKLCIKQIQAIIFDLTDSLGKKDTLTAMNVLKGLISNKEPVQKILVTLYNHFKKLYIIKIAEKNREDATKALSLKPNQMFLVSKYKAQARYFKENELRSILDELINLDANYKIGLIDLEIGLESILCRYCSK